MSRWRRDLAEGAGVLVAVLALGLAAGSGARAEEGVGAGALSAAEAQARIEELSERIQGMEGKLKDSAAARKTADQARMEAERRLAEGSEELGRQGAEIALLREAKLALEARLKRAEEETASAAEALTNARDALRRLSAERDAASQRAASLERQLNALFAQQQRPDDRPRARESGPARPPEALSRVDGGGEAPQGLTDSGEPSVPAAQSTDVTLAQVREEAGAAALALREAIAPGAGARDPQARRTAREAEQALHRCQLRVARMTGARSLYRVRPSDTLVLIAERFYGERARWREIHEANWEVLPDPDRLSPGLTLVIP